MLRSRARSLLRGLMHPAFALGPHRLHRRIMPARAAALSSSGLRMLRQRTVRCAAARLLLECAFPRSRSSSGRLLRIAVLSLLVLPLCALPRALAGLALRRRRQRNTRAPRLAQPDCNRLLRRPRTMLAFTYVLNLLVHKLSRGGRR